jgi:1-aminocyclopropane-1-carboxylate deaminase
MQEKLLRKLPLMTLHYNEPTVIEFHDEITERAGIRLLIRREDLNHKYISGNKWWKLKYNLAEAREKGHHSILTFGGAFSNHIFSTAAAANELGFKSIGIIRGEEILPLNNTLDFASRSGMKLHFLSREQYRAKTDENFVEKLRDSLGDFYLIPEGGTNNLAVRGCQELASDKLSRNNFDYLILPVGTGGTIAGLICGFKGQKIISGISVLKNGEFLVDEVSTLVKNYSGTSYGNWNILTSYDHGGYAKVNDSLNRFIATMKEKHNLPLDHVYTGKTMWAVLKEAETGAFARGSTVMVLHTGGLQGAKPIYNHS